MSRWWRRCYQPTLHSLQIFSSICSHAMSLTFCSRPDIRKRPEDKKKMLKKKNNKKILKRLQLMLAPLSPSKRTEAESRRRVEDRRRAIDLWNEDLIYWYLLITTTNVANEGQWMGRPFIGKWRETKRKEMNVLWCPVYIFTAVVSQRFDGVATLHKSEWMLLLFARYRLDIKRYYSGLLWSFTYSA